MSIHAPFLLLKNGKGVYQDLGATLKYWLTVKHSQLLGKIIFSHFCMKNLFLIVLKDNILNYRFSKNCYYNLTHKIMLWVHFSHLWQKKMFLFFFCPGTVYFYNQHLPSCSSWFWGSAPCTLPLHLVPPHWRGATMVKMLKHKTISTSKWCVKHPLAGWNTQHFSLHSVNPLFLCNLFPQSKISSKECIFSYGEEGNQKEEKGP